MGHAGVAYDVAFGVSDVLRPLGRSRPLTVAARRPNTDERGFIKTLTRGRADELYIRSVGGRARS